MNYEIAGVRFAYTPDSKELAKRLTPYLTHREAEVTFSAIPGQRESVELLRSLSYYQLAHTDGLLLHCAAIIYKGKGLLFVAPSGVGKTTHAKLWTRHLPGARVLNGDKPFLRCTQGGVQVCGSPWQGKENMGENSCVPVAGVYLLHRADENRTEPVDVHSALPALMDASLTPRNPEELDHILKKMELLLSCVPVCKLYCNMQARAARVALDWAEKEAGLCK